jgi:hypothetical protein
MSTQPSQIAFSEEVVDLVRTVERLSSEDQQRILRIVDLLLVAPRDVRTQTQRMLRALLDRQPESKAECVTGVEEIIMFLEHRVIPLGPRSSRTTTRH